MFSSVQFSSFRSTLATIALTGALFGLTVGCSSDTSGTETGGGSGTGCTECGGGQIGPIYCECQVAVGDWDPLPGGDACIPANADPNAWCSNKCSDVHNADILGMGKGASCLEAAPSCYGWNPSAYVEKEGGVYEIDATWFDGVVEDPSQLLGCDDAGVVPATGGGFQVVNAGSGELMYILGIRNGDRPVSLNGLPLTSFVDGGAAYTLYLEGVTSYTLVLLRGSTLVTLSFSLV